MQCRKAHTLLSSLPACRVPLCITVKHPSRASPRQMCCVSTIEQLQSFMSTLRSRKHRSGASGGISHFASVSNAFASSQAECTSGAAASSARLWNSRDTFHRALPAESEALACGSEPSAPESWRLDDARPRRRCTTFARVAARPLSTCSTRGCSRQPWALARCSLPHRPSLSHAQCAHPSKPTWQRSSHTIMPGSHTLP